MKFYGNKFTQTKESRSNTWTSLGTNEDTNAGKIL